jgi:hypothetical protein
VQSRVKGASAGRDGQLESGCTVLFQAGPDIAREFGVDGLSVSGHRVRLRVALAFLLTVSACLATETGRPAYGSTYVSLDVARAAHDLSCPESAVSVYQNRAGGMFATGCQSWVEYRCFYGHHAGLCVEEQRGGATVSRGSRRLPLGSEGGACFPNDTCMAPLQCVWDMCIRPAGPRRAGGACVKGECETPFACVNDRCEPPPRELRSAVPRTGTRSGRCYPNDTCDQGLRCDVGLCVDSDVGG